MICSKEHLFGFVSMFIIRPNKTRISISHMTILISCVFISNTVAITTDVQRTKWQEDKLCSHSYTNVYQKHFRQECFWFWNGTTDTCQKWEVWYSILFRASSTRRNTVIRHNIDFTSGRKTSVFVVRGSGIIIDFYIMS